jgi:hypothetical protein
MTQKLNIDKTYSNTVDRRPAGNSTYKKLAVQWLNEALCFVSSSVVAESFVLRNRQLLVAAKRCAQGRKKDSASGQVTCLTTMICFEIECRLTNFKLLLSYDDNFHS